MRPSKGGLGRDVLQSQLELVSLVWRDPRFRSLMLAIWVSDFGGALHAPVLTFFFREVGATAVHIGLFGVMSSAGAFLLAPFYGWLVDARSIYWPVLASCGLCGFACLWRGLATTVWELFAAEAMMGLSGANIWGMAKGFVAAHTDPVDRSLVVSGFDFQNMVFMLAGKACYQPLSGLVHLLAPGCSTMMFYRLFIGICTFFCLAGSLILVLWGGPLLATPPPKTSVGADAVVVPATVRLTGGPQCFVAVCALLMCQSAALSSVTTLWPLFVQDSFGWAAHEYSILLIVQGMATAWAVASVPAFAARSTYMVLASNLAFLAAFGCIAFVLPHGNSGTGRVFGHVIPAACFFAAAAALGPTLASIASLLMSRHQQGRSFGALATATTAGSVVGNLVGTSLYTHSKAMSRGMGSGGRLPFVLVSVVLGLCGVCLTVVKQWVTLETDGRSGRARELDVVNDNDEVVGLRSDDT